MRARRRRIYPVEAVLLEKHRTVGQRRRARPLSVRAAAGPPRIRRHPLVARPVFKIAQLAAVKLVHRLPVRHTVLAAPEPVAAFGDKVHIRHTPGRLHRPARDLRCLVDQPHDDDRTLVCAVYNLAAVQLFELLVPGKPGDLNAVILFEALADAVRRQLHIHRRHGHPLPRGLGPLLDGVQTPRRVQPILPVRRAFRLRRLREAQCQRLPVRKTQRHADRRFRRVDRILMPHVPVVGIILRVEVNSVWEDTQIRAHGHELLFSRLDVHRRHIRLHGRAVDMQNLILHPAQPVPRADRLHP